MADRRKTDETKIAVLETLLKVLTEKVEELSTKMDSLREKIDEHYVTKEDFVPVKNDVEKLKYWQIKVIAYASAAAFVIQYLPGILESIVKNIAQ